MVERLHSVAGALQLVNVFACSLQRIPFAARGRFDDDVVLSFIVGLELVDDLEAVFLLFAE